MRSFGPSLNPWGRCVLALAVLAAGAAGALAAGPDQDPADGPIPEPSVAIFGAAGEPQGADAPRGNPLWAVPLERLSATRERPLFSPSRRPPALAVPAPPQVSVPVAAPPPPAVPRLTLIGTVVGPAESFGIFVDAATSKVVRLRTGEAHEGWSLRKVSPRDVTLRSDAGSVTLALPERQARDSASAPSPRGASGAASAAGQAAGPAAGPTAPRQSIVVPRRPQPSPTDSDPSH